MLSGFFVPCQKISVIGREEETGGVCLGVRRVVYVEEGVSK